MLLGTNVERRSSMFGPLLLRSNWFTTFIEGMIDWRRVRKRLKQEHTDIVKEERR